MLTFFGFLTIAIILVLLMIKKTTVQFALTFVPFIIALIAGFAFKDVAGYAAKGLSSILATGLTCLFATLLFGALFDAGMFDPVINGVIKISGGDPIKICVGTAVIAMLTHLDGSATSTYLISVSALLPIYTTMQMNPVTLATIVGLSSGVVNMLPWGGPTLRAATVLQMEVAELYRSIIPMQVVGMILALIVAAIFGIRERKAIGYVKGQISVKLEMGKLEGADELRRPKLVVVNIVFVIILMTALIAGWASSAVLFMLALPVALLINFRSVDIQKKRIDAHAVNALGTTSVIFCAGIFSGVLTNTGMMEAMAKGMASVVPHQLGGVMQYLMVIFSVPFSLIFDPDSFYYGVLPVLSQAAAEFGVAPVVMARAAIMGMISVGTVCCPLIGSTWLLMGLTKVNLGDVQKKALPFAFIMSLIMGLFGIIIGRI
jgi:CitMHS family citrate-Mg2+:H+ or citrate-Ca2+:H+ symporter